jgi:hypothetical protein
MFKAARAIVKEIVDSDDAAQHLIVTIDGQDARAVSYRAFTRELEPGDAVLVNTTAVALGLGTGGCHFVIAPLERAEGALREGPGHIMKLRYTPHQHAVMSVEEEGSPHRAAIEGFAGLDGFPVVVASLHSQVAPVAIVLRALCGVQCRLAYIMTDTAALALPFSRSVAELRRRRLLDTTITCGQAFGGEHEAVNVYTALIAAREALGADVAIVAQGPGNVGAGTRYGFGGIAQGEIVNAVGILGGTAIAVLRLSFAESRERHRGVSHHSLTALGKVALMPAIIPIPAMANERERSVMAQLEGAAIPGDRHSVLTVDTSAAQAALAAHPDLLRSMGRSYDDDPEFFLAAAAAGVVATDRVKNQQGGIR